MYVTAQLCAEVPQPTQRGEALPRADPPCAEAPTVSSQPAQTDLYRVDRVCSHQGKRPPISCCKEVGRGGARTGAHLVVGLVTGSLLRRPCGFLNPGCSLGGLSVSVLTRYQSISSSSSANVSLQTLIQTLKI